MSSATAVGLCMQHTRLWNEVTYPVDLSNKRQTCCTRVCSVSFVALCSGLHFEVVGKESLEVMGATYHSRGAVTVEVSCQVLHSSA